jgi:hypothetical protein
VAVGQGSNIKKMNTLARKKTIIHDIGNKEIPHNLFANKE